MGLIRLDKEYEKLYVVGCSFTTGFLEKDKGSWGTYLAEKLNYVLTTPTLISKSELIAYALTFDYNKICERVEKLLKTNN